MASFRRRFLFGLMVTVALPSLVFATNLTAQQRTEAVDATATNAPQCRRIGDFYWEIGDKNGVRGSGAVGHRFTAQRVIPIASGSKWVFGSYVLEKIGRNTEPTPEQVSELEMTSGYTGLKYARCIFQKTVAGCFHHRGNDKFVAANVGKFFYNGGHDQKLAIDLGLGDFDSKQLTAEFRKYLGGDLGMAFNSPQLAGGMRASPRAYGRFLRRILDGELRMHDYLDYKPVCTYPKTCKQAAYSPVPSAWHYSLNHWIEDGPGDDGAYSSPGAFGFYPWISADKQWYGILARESRWPWAAKESVYCGVKLRRAWMTGEPQY